VYELSDYSEIRNVLGRYFQYGDDKEWQRLGALLAEDFEYAADGQLTRGREAYIRSTMAAAVPALPHGRHLLCNTVIEIREESATASSDWIWVAALGVPASMQLSVLGMGRCTDLLGKMGGRWLLRRREGQSTAMPAGPLSRTGRVVTELSETPDEEAIRNVLGRYYQLVDDHDYATWGSLVADRYKLLVNGRITEGREANTSEHIDEHPVTQPRAHHLLTNTTIEIDCQRATASSDWIWVAQVEVQSYKRLLVLEMGRAVDVLGKFDGQWKLIERDQRPFFFQPPRDTSRTVRSAVRGDA
jgi:hypothetical protein